MQSHEPSSLPDRDTPSSATPLDPRAALQQLREQRAEDDLAANWERYYEQLDAPRQAWADILIRTNWHWFATLTFKPDQCAAKGGMHPERADKAYRFWISTVNRQLWGPRWSSKRAAAGGLIWARGQEFHKDGRIHFHALVSHPHTDLNERVRRLGQMDWWYRKFGIARIEPPSGQGQVCGYVSKYVVKGGEVDLSDNFGRVTPPLVY